MLERHTRLPVRDLVEAAKTCDATPAEWIRQTGSLSALIGYLDLVWRDFVVHDGCLLREGFTLENFNQWMNATNGDRTAVEAMMNHEHILDLFVNHESELTSEQVLLAGRVLREMWCAKLSKDYPHLPVTVSFPDDELFEDLLDYEITVYLNRPIP
jgi:hypothetical protein